MRCSRVSFQSQINFCFNLKISIPTGTLSSVRNTSYSLGSLRNTSYSLGSLRNTSYFATIVSMFCECRTLLSLMVSITKSWQLKDTTDKVTSASYLDLYIGIQIEDRLRSSLLNKLSTL